MASITIKINSVSGVTCTLFGSKSTANDTDFSWDSSTNTATFTSSGSSSGPDISYLPFIDYSSGSPVDKRYNNSVALNLQWATGEQTVVLSGNVQSATWYINSTNILPSANTHYFCSAGASLTVTPVKASSSVTAADYVSKVTIGGYWRTNYGGVDGAQAGDIPPTGIFTSPVKWAAKHNNTQTTRRVPISWDAPASASASKIQYYIVVGWKGNWGSNLDVATSFLCSPNASSVLDTANWWDGAETIDGGSPGKLLYTVHALYSDKGVVPSLEEGQDHNVSRTTPDWGIWRAFADNGETLVTLRFYDYNNGGTPSLIRDATTGDTEFTALKNKSLISSYIPTSGFPQVDGKYYIAEAFSKNTRDSRPLANPNLSESALGKATGDLDIAIKLVPPTVNITFKSNYPSGTTGGGTADRVESWMPGSVQQLLSAPNPPTKTGYIYAFNGWWTNASSGTKVGDAGQNYTVPNSGTTLWAHWKETVILYDIKYSSDGRDPSTIIQLPYGTAVTINNKGGSGDPSFTVNSNKTIRNPSQEDFVFAGYDYSNNTFTARWIPFWDWDDETLIFLAYKRPKLNISVKRDSLQNPDQVVMLEKPTLCPLLNKQGEDRNYVSSTSKVEYREEDRQDKTWSSEATRCYESRGRYGNPEYPTWQNSSGENTPLQNDKNSPFRTDLMSNAAKTKRLSLDIDKEWQVRARIYDALEATSSYTHTTGTKTLDSGDEYSTQSPYSNIALLIKYVTKLFVHNPFMDEVIKERRSDKDHRVASTPPETDYWQIREHTQSSSQNIDDFKKLAAGLHSILKDRSEAKSINGFNPTEVEDYIIPNLKRALVDGEYLVYDYSQMEKITAILEKINSDHEKVIKEVNQFGLSGSQTYNNQYELLEVGNYKPDGKYLQRVLDLDGERHTTSSTTYTPESGNLANRVQDTIFQKVELANFDDEQVKKNPDAEKAEAATTISHISNYDISSLDLRRSLSDFIYMLSRMRTREEGDEGPKGQFNDSSKDDYNQTTYLDDNLKVKSSAFTNWSTTDTTYEKISGTWTQPENPISEYDSAGITNYSIFKDSYEYGNNGCRAACMGLCETSCYSSCVGGCKTACGDSCFHRCTSTCVAKCSNTCASVCDRGCNESCGTACSKSCGSACTQNCADGCSGTCGDTCNKGCAKTCTTVCHNGCNQNCGAICSKQCSTACNLGCAQSCGQECRGNCGGACSQQCGTQCNGTCSAACATQCQGTCGDTCQGTCREGCKDSCGSSCYGQCKDNCEARCSNSCTNGCYTECNGTCKVNCSNGCSGNCSGACSGGCELVCTNHCGNSCKGFCEGTCATTCKGDCATECKGDCKTNCGTACGTSCDSECEGNCTGGCNSNCSVNCGSSCLSKCISSCAGTCKNNCAQSCWSDCSNTCNNTCLDFCVQGCSKSCETNCGLGCGTLCSSGCTGGCTGTCNGACANSCWSTCNGTCVSGCKGSAS